MEGLKKELEKVLNIACAENGSNTPDFILAKYILTCLYAFDGATRERDKWYGVHLEPANKYFEG